MHFAFTAEQLLFRDALRDLLARECDAVAVRAAWEGSGRVPGLWAHLADMGVVGLTAPESVGGLGLDETTLVLLLEEAGRAACPEPLLEHTAVAIPALVQAGALDLAGAATAGSMTIAVQLGETTGVSGADRVLVRDGERLLLAHAPTGSPQRSIDGTRRLARADTKGALLLAGADAELAFDRAALGAAAMAVGVGQHLLERTVDYVAHRHQFGKPVGSYQAVKHHLASVALALEFARPYVYRAAWCVAAGDPDRRREVSAAKALASDAVDRAGRAALQCHGAIGYAYEYDLQLWLKRGWTLSASFGDAVWHRDRVAEGLGL